MRLWKKKLPSREDKPLREHNKITGMVLDNYTVDVLIKLLNRKTIKSMDYAVSSGKEAVVFRATLHDGTFIAVKIFKFETTGLRHMGDYIDGDPRFRKVRHSRRPLILDWARKEFANLKAATAAGVSCPHPFRLRGNVVLMEFMGVEGKPYAQLANVTLEDPEAFFRKLMDDVRKLYAAGLVHADLSQYNVLVRQETEGGKQLPIIIDWGQGVLLEHPKSMEFLARDVLVLCNYFKKLGVDCDPAVELGTIKAAFRKRPDRHPGKKL